MVLRRRFILERRAHNMSWYRQIKSFYTISINMYFFIIWGIISSIILNNKVDYRLYFVMIASTFLYQFLMNKMKGSKLPKIISILAGLSFTFVVNRGIYFVFNSVFMIFVLYMAGSIENETINYDIYRTRTRNGLILLIILGALLPLVDISLSKSILKFYIMFLVLSIVVLREARSYFYKVKSKRSFTVNMLMCLSILALSIEMVFEKILMAGRMIMNIINIVVNGFIELLSMLLAKPLMFIIENLRVLIIKNIGILNRTPISITESNLSKDPITWEKAESLAVPIWFNIVVKIFAVLIILILLYIFVMKVINIYGTIDNAAEEQREKIKKIDKKREGFVRRLINNLIVPSDIRGQILSVYRRFEDKTYEKGIFKKYMTAKQLENVTKVHLENPEGLSSLTSIYNEAKFSQHQPTEQDVKAMKDGFSKVKKQL
jgi:hypothetical protein